MNTAIALGIGLEGVAFLILGFVVALRTKRQYGFLSPLGFMCAVLLNRICRFLSIPLITRAVSEADQDKMRTAASKLTEDDRIFYLGINGHADGIWFLGAMLFLFSGWLDLKSAGKDSSRKSRLTLMVIGSLLIVLSVFYPVWMRQRIG